MKKILVFVFGLLLVFGKTHAQAIDENCTQNGDSACIDWDRGVVIADGLGVPAQFATNAALRNASAQRAARLDAARNILEMIKGVNLSSETTVQDAMVTSDTIRTSIRGRIHGLRTVGKPKYFSDGTIKIRMEARLLKTIPEELLFRQQAKAVVQIPQEIKTSSKPATPVIDTNQVYTGMIIDARTVEVQPAMSPRIYDENGNEVYGSAYVDREFVVQHGMAGYAKDLEKAKLNDRVKGAPLIIKALGATGKNNTDLIIKNNDADALRKMATKQSFLREARVMILL